MQQPVNQPLAQAIALFRQGRTADAIRLIGQLAESGDADALFTLGDAYWRGAGVRQDLQLARDFFRRASDAGQPMAIRAHTNLLASGIAGPRDWRTALERLEGEARQDGLRQRMQSLIRSMDLTPSGDPRSVPAGELLSEQPWVTLFRKAFTDGECDFLKLIAEPTYEPSVVHLDGQSIRAGVRTSDGSTIHWLIEDPATHALNRRLAALSGTDVERGEPLQILRYRPGHEYRPHTDWLPEGNRRIMTALIYLNEDYQGGETAFVRTGLKIKGSKGDALVFRSLAGDGDLDPLSEHAGLPVASGCKYLASRWIRERRHTP